jgi:hypothetical protein
MVSYLILVLISLNINAFVVDNKSQGSARSTECSHSSTAAVETEEQLLGVGHLPKGMKNSQLSIN